MRSWFLLLILIPGLALAEPDEPEIFAPVEKSGLALGILELPIYSFYLGAPDIHGVAYVPNFSPRLGTLLRWRDFGIVLTLGLPPPPEEMERRGPSDQLNFVITKYWRESGFDLYFQNYRGFYLSNPQTELDLHKPDRYPQLPDAEITNYGLNYYRILNPRRFSLSAAFEQSEYQLESGGSWIVSGFYNHLQMSLGKKFILGSDANAVKELPSFHGGNFDTLGLGVGYGYTWVMDGFFITGRGILGVGLQRQQVDQDQIAME